MNEVGHVRRKHIAAGSKSERDAIVLATDHGDFVLRRVGANAFKDPELEALVGRRVECEGQMLGGYTFLATRVSPID